MHTLDYDIFKQLVPARSLIRTASEGWGGLVVPKWGEWLVPGKPDGFL